MKTVILIGDSIRMYYEQTVREQLAGLAEIWSPEDNGGNSSNVLAHLDDWVIARGADLVHVNCGLHDIKTEFAAGEAAVPLAPYTANVRTILSRIKSETPATVIWAQTTPVNEKRHHERKPFDRLEADVDSYNAAARAVAEELEIPINDLYRVVQEAGPDSVLKADGVHFKDEGSVLLGEAVADFIRPYLAGDG